VLEQLEILGGEVVPVLRKEFAKNRPAHVPDGPTHAALVAAHAHPVMQDNPPELALDGAQ
jgi:hypothetical protein